MEKGGGERLRFDGSPETTPGINEPVPATSELEYRPVPQTREMGPAPATSTEIHVAEPVNEANHHQVTFSEADLRQEVVVSDLSSLEDRMTAGMSE